MVRPVSTVAVVAAVEAAEMWVVVVVVEVRCRIEDLAGMLAGMDRVVVVAAVAY